MRDFIGLAMFIIAMLIMGIYLLLAFSAGVALTTMFTADVLTQVKVGGIMVVIAIISIFAGVIHLQRRRE